MLAVATGQLRYPMTLFVSMEVSDGLFHTASRDRQRMLRAAAHDHPRISGMVAIATHKPESFSESLYDIWLSNVLHGFRE
jgi:hypothetical protein